MTGLNAQKLKVRFLGALLIAPAFLAVVYMGGLVFQIVLALAACIALFEWFKLSKSCSNVWLMLVAGVPYIASSFASFVILRIDYGMILTFLLLIYIWASDVGAYFAGKIIGGPKMAEKISPNKTWAGMMGALLWPGLLGAGFVFAVTPDIDLLKLGGIAGIGVLIGAAGQLGDLLISGAKRMAKLKDTGDLIPGHGGLLDRIDSLLLASPLFLFILWAMPHAF